jgi:hypothetical protein
VFEKRIGCFGDNEGLGARMVEANQEIFKYSGILKFSLPLYKIISTPKWSKLVKAEDFFYSKAIALVDDTILRFTRALENDEKNSRFYLLSYFLSRYEFRKKCYFDFSYKI